MSDPSESGPTFGAAAPHGGAPPSQARPDHAAVARPSTCTGCTASLTTSWLVDSTATAVREALADMILSVTSCGTHQELIYNAEMVLAEVLNNVVEHAYQEQPDGWIRIEIFCHPDTLNVRVSDGGVPMPRLSLPSGTAQRLDGTIDDLPEGGFGWFMIRELTSDLSYRREGDRNITEFRLLPPAQGL